MPSPAQFGVDEKLQSGLDPEDKEDIDKLLLDGFRQFVQKIYGHANLFFAAAVQAAPLKPS